MRQGRTLFNRNTLHILIYYAAIFIITPARAPLYPLILWTGMFIFSTIIVLFYVDKIPEAHSNLLTRKPYGKIHRLTLASSFLFLMTCISFTIPKYLDVEIPATLTIFTIALIIYTITSHIKSIDNTDNTLLRKATLLLKYSWLFISIISYFLARSVISATWDIPFEPTSNKLTTITTSLFFGAMFYCFIYFLFLLVLLAFHTQKFGRKRHGLKVNRAFSVIVPLLTIGYVSLIAFFINTLPLLVFGFEKSISYDTRDTFYCNNNYMVLNHHPDARFLFISEGNYRAVIPRNNDYYISRLYCTDKKPFYLLVDVQDKKDLRKSILKKNIENLKNDIDAISKNI